MANKYKKSLIPISQALRREMTPEEKHLWYDFLRLLPITVNRQKVIESFIVDFYIHSANIVIEVDGIQHGSVSHINADNERDERLKKLGIKVLRYPNSAVNERYTDVCNSILEHLGLKYSDLKNKS